MRIIFMGTPDFAVPALTALVEAGHEVVAAYSQPPRPAGRGKQLMPSPVQRKAEELGIAVRYPASLRDPEAQADFAALKADVAIVAAYGLILPQAVLDIPRLGCINIHASLLPRWRGAAPIVRAIEAGDAETGVTIMRMAAGLDTGPMLLSESLPIASDDNAARLHDKLAALGARLVVDALHRIDALTPEPQPTDGVTYAHKIDKAEALLDFARPAEELARRIRAFDPFPGAAGVIAGVTVKLWSAVAEAGTGVPGTVVAVDGRGIVIACGEGLLRIGEAQKPGGKRLPAGDFLHGFAIAAGSRFGGATS